MRCVDLALPVSTSSAATHVSRNNDAWSIRSLTKLLKSRLLHLHLRAVAVLGRVVDTCRYGLQDEAFGDQSMDRAVYRVDIGCLTSIQLLHALARVAGLARCGRRRKRELGAVETVLIPFDESLFAKVVARERGQRHGDIRHLHTRAFVPLRVGGWLRSEERRVGKEWR